MCSCCCCSAQKYTQTLPRNIFICTHAGGPRKKKEFFFFRPAYTCVHRSTIEWKGEEKKKKDLSWFGGGSANKQTNIQNTTMPPSSYDLLVSQYYIPYAVFSPSRYSDRKNNRFFFLDGLIGPCALLKFHRKVPLTVWPQNTKEEIRP